MEPTAVHQQHASPPRPTATGAPQGTRKLRESCISCSRSKVKCDKEKPICGRCVRRGLPCEYMVSRRTGRTRVIGIEKPSTGTTTATETTANSSTSNASSNPSSIATDHSNHSTNHARIAQRVDTAHHTLPVVTPHTPAITARPSPKSLHIQSPPHESDLWNALLSPNTSTSTDLSSLLSINSDLGQLFASLSPSHVDEPDEMDTDLHLHGLGELSVADPSSALMQGLEGPDSIPAPASTPKTHPCCLAICLDILMRLFPNARVSCQQPGSQDGPSKLCTIESVIEDNKQILDTIQTVLECRCAEDEYVATLVSLIVFKVLGWYVAVARDRSSDPGPDELASGGFESGSHSRRPSMSSFEEQVLHLPTVIGGYCVDGHHQSRMAAQLVLSELYRVQRLVTLVSRRLEALRHRSPSSESSTSSSSVSSSVLDSGGGYGSLALSGIPTSPLSSTTLAHLEDDLRKRLRAVSSETINILRRA
ncbi:aflatoxin regulatory protein-domain-containing protein [Aspergillus cavernicola]|uniref:Aflatoxin regulatory protein-domain-containing protein n=1 Tax=Aspergillus cavernicola TaxID=176166 RepID=A0ABR4HX37_9EURO